MLSHGECRVGTGPAVGRTRILMISMREIASFGTVGCLATAVHLVAFFAAHRGLHLHPTLATTVAFACAVGVSYSLNRSWTFRVGGRHARQLPRFVSIALCSAVLNAAIMHLGVEVLGWSPNFSLLIILLTLPALSFGLQKRWGFR